MLLLDFMRTGPRKSMPHLLNGRLAEIRDEGNGASGAGVKAFALYLKQVVQRVLGSRNIELDIIFLARGVQNDCRNAQSNVFGPACNNLK